MNEVIQAINEQSSSVQLIIFCIVIWFIYTAFRWICIPYEIEKIADNLSKIASELEEINKEVKNNG